MSSGDTMLCVIIALLVIRSFNKRYQERKAWEAYYKAGGKRAPNEDIEDGKTA